LSGITYHADRECTLISLGRRAGLQCHVQLSPSGYAPALNDASIAGDDRASPKYEICDADDNYLRKRKSFFFNLPVKN